MSCEVVDQHLIQCPSSPVQSFVLQNLQSGVAAEVLELGTLDPATLQIRSRCRDDLESISMTGSFTKGKPSLLFAILHMMAKFFYAETQSIEGLNSIVKLLGRRCPSISLELLSSRLSVKRLIGQADGTTGCRKKWSAVKQLAETEVVELADFATACLPVLADTGRWMPAAPAAITCSCPAVPGGCGEEQSATPPLPPPLPVCHLVDPDMCGASMSEGMWKWAKSYNLGWKWSTHPGSRSKHSKTKLKQAHTSDGMGLMILPTIDLADMAYYLVADRFSHSVSFCRLQVSNMRASSEAEPEPCVRWEFADSVESTLLFMKYFQTCTVHRNNVMVKACFLDMEMCDRLFSESGCLPVAEIQRKSAVCFEMDSHCMKGVAEPKKKKPHKPDVQPDELPEEHEQEEESAYLNPDVGLCDMSGPEDDANNASDEDGERAADSLTSLELKSGYEEFSARQIHDVARTLDAVDCTSPEAEEEALLFLIRKKTKTNMGTHRRH